MDLFNSVYLRTLSVLLLTAVCSSLSIDSITSVNAKELLKCNSYADRGREPLPRGKESPFVLQVTRTEVEEYISEIGFQYRGWFNSARIVNNFLSSIDLLQYVITIHQKRPCTCYVR